MEKPVLKDLLDLREKRGCLASSTCGGVGQAVVEMHRLYTQVSAFEDNRDMTAIRETHSWVKHFRHHGDLDTDFSLNFFILFSIGLRVTHVYLNFSLWPHLGHKLLLMSLMKRIKAERK